MKVYIAKDWTGSKVFAEPPSLLKNLPGFPPTWTGHKLPFDINSFTEDEIPRGEYLERNIWWSIIHVMK